MPARLRAPAESANRQAAPSGCSRPAWSARVPRPGDPLPDDVAQYLDHLRIQRNRPSSTLRGYRQDLAKFVAFRALADPDAHVCDGLDREGLRRYQVELADVLPHPRSRARALVALRQFLGYAYDEGWIATELSRTVTVPRYVVGDPHPIPTEAVPPLLAMLPSDTLRDKRDRALIHFLVSTGCRIGEACSLDRTDLRRDGMRVLGKGGKYRTVYCTEQARAAVDDYLRARGPDHSPALFISVAQGDMRRGVARPHNRLTPDGARRVVAALRRRLSTSPELLALIGHLRSPHGARHTAATTLLEATNGDVRLVQEVLGHATLETLRVYTEITDRRKRAAYRRLGEYLHETGSSRRAGRAT